MKYWVPARHQSWGGIFGSFLRYRKSQKNCSENDVLLGRGAAIEVTLREGIKSWGIQGCWILVSMLVVWWLRARHWHCAEIPDFVRGPIRLEYSWSEMVLYFSRFLFVPSSEGRIVCPQLSVLSHCCVLVMKSDRLTPRYIFFNKTLIRIGHLWSLKLKK